MFCRKNAKFETIKTNVIMKSILCSLSLLILIPFLSHAQIESEIRSFNDSTEFYLENGRRLLIKSLSENDVEKVLEIQAFLNKKTNSTSYNAFSYGEELCIAMLTNRWDEASRVVKSYLDIRKPDFPYNYEILTFLYTKVKDDGKLLEQNCKSADIDQEVKDILLLLIYYVDKNTADEIYYERLNSIYANHEPLENEAFLDGFLPGVKIYGSMGIALGGGMTFPNGGFGDNYNPCGDFFFTLDGKVERAYFAFTLNTGKMKLKKSFDIVAPFEFSFEEGYRFTYLNVGGRLGYLIIRNKYFHLAPYAQISYSALYSNEFASDTEDKEYYDMNAFTVGPGIHTEVKLFEFKDSAYGTGNNTTKHAVSLMFSGGYNFNFGFTDPEVKGNTVYFDAGLVMRFGGM